MTDNSRMGRLDDSFRRALPELGVDFQPDHSPDPKSIVVNDSLAAGLGIDTGWLRSDDGVAVLSGNSVPGHAHPFAMAYAGHQFGNYSPRLGDGRALLLGELTDPGGNLVDVHLKGSGRTPFSRGGDGKAALGPMLREYLVAEAMHSLGVRTGRSLGVASTGALIARETTVPAAVLTRVAASHIRVGTFEYAARLPTAENEPSVTQRLTDYAITRHYPALAEAEGVERYVGFFGEVLETQASLLAHWMLVGFVHGVMNTDNMTVGGETIDYGPCAFVDGYDPATVFSSIDRNGRYAYQNQPAIAQWNLARLAETLIPLLADGPDEAIEVATEALHGFPARYQAHWTRGMTTKLGLDPSADHLDPTTGINEAQRLAEDYLNLLATNDVDYTNSFRWLADYLNGDSQAITNLGSDDETSPWRQRWEALISPQDDRAAVAKAMNQVNPIYIPRNHLVEEALDAAVAGEMALFNDLLERISQPFMAVAGADRFATGAPDGFYDRFQTFCGT